MMMGMIEQQIGDGKLPRAVGWVDVWERRRQVW